MKSQDILILLSILTWKGPKRTYERLSESTGIGKTPTLHAVKRLEKSKLFNNYYDKVNIPAVKEFLIHGVKYVFPHSDINEKSKVVKGFVTGISHPVFQNKINYHKKYVWPSEIGNAKGLVVTPIHHSIPEKCYSNIELIELFALIDVLRIGRIREIAIAEKLLLEKLTRYE